MLVVQMDYQVYFTRVLSRALNALSENSLYHSYGMPKWSSNLNHLAYVMTP